MSFALESSRRRGPLEFIVEQMLEFIAESDIENHPAVGANEVMVVCAGDRLGELEAGMIIAGDDAMHHTGFLQNGEVPVGRTLRQPRSRLEESDDREWVVGVVKTLNERPPIRGVALIGLAETLKGGVVDLADASSFGRGHESLP